MKVFARFQDPEAHDGMVESMVKEKQIREVINQLRKFHKAGFCSLDQVQRYITLNKRQV